MNVTRSQSKPSEIMSLTRTWLHKETATLQELHSLVGKLIYMAQCCPPARLFTNRMLITLRACPEQGAIHFLTEFRKDLMWFYIFLLRTDGIFLIHEDDKEPICLSLDACISGCRAGSHVEAYHMEFPSISNNRACPYVIWSLGGRESVGSTVCTSACPSPV